MNLEYKILESSTKEGVLTVKIENMKLAFNHSLVHNKDDFEDFEHYDCSIVKVKGVNLYHINGRVITLKQYKFVRDIINDMNELYQLNWNE